MPDYAHHINHQSISEAVIGFSQMARENGLKVGVRETEEAIRCAALGIPVNRDRFRYALRSIFCATPEEKETFDQIFDWYWGAEKGRLRSRTHFKNQSNLQKKTSGSLVMLGMGESPASDDREDSRSTAGANAVERLRKTDFSQLAETDSRLLEEIALKLWRQMSRRLRRKSRSSRRKDRVDLRKTIRNGIQHGGNFGHLQYKTRQKDKQRLIVLLDVSGSMDKYSFFLLRFLYALRRYFEKVEAFLFSTQLVRISDHLDTKNLPAALALLSAQANHWSGGTRIGECLQNFNDSHAKRILHGRSTVIILSDGLDTGPPEKLATELRKIKLRTRQLIWLNPLKGMAGYEPIQRGMNAALPEIDIFRSAHNLDSILELENLLFNV